MQFFLQCPTNLKRKIVQLKQLEQGYTLQQLDHWARVFGETDNGQESFLSLQKKPGEHRCSEGGEKSVAHTYNPQTTLVEFGLGNGLPSSVSLPSILHLHRFQILFL